MNFKFQISNSKFILLAIVVLLNSCTSPTPKQPKAVVADFAAGSWTLAERDFAQGELEGLVIEEGILRLESGALQGTFTSTVYDTGVLFDALTFNLSPSAIGGQPSAVSRQLLQARTSLDGEIWSPWTELPLDESDDSRDDDDADHGQIVPVTAGRYVQVKLILTGGDLRSVKLDYMYAAAGPTAYQAKSAAQPVQHGEGVPRPAIIPRAGWGAKESMMTWKPHYRYPVRVVIHHTVTPNNEENPAATVRTIYYFHAITRKWGDIGYNYLIDWQGNIYEGRYGGEQVIGGHARGYNEGSVGIALMGKFTNQDITPAMRRSLVELLAWVTAHYGIDTQGQGVAYGRTLPNILGHRVVANTNCPGDVFYAQLDDVRAQVAAEVARHGGIAAITATPKIQATQKPPTRTPTPQPTLVATQTRQLEITPTLAIPATDVPTFTPVPNTPTPLPTPTLAPTPTSLPARISITGMDVQPYPPQAGQPFTVAVSLLNPGPSELTQVSVQVLFDAKTVETSQIGLAWQIDRLRAGQKIDLLSPEGTSLAMNAGAHTLFVRAAAHDQDGRVLSGEWGPTTLSIIAAGEGAPQKGWRAVAERWASGISQAWLAFQDWVYHLGGEM